MVKFALAILAICAGVVRADLTLVQRIEGGLNAGQMTLRIKDGKARADLAPQVSTITDLANGETITLQHAARVFLKISAEQARVVFDQVKQKQQAANAAPPKLTPTGRKEKVEAHECEVFTWSVGEIHATDWIARDYPNAAAVLAALGNFQSAGLGGAARPLQPAMSEFPGVLIRREMTVSGQKTITTLLSVSDAPIAPAVFIVPADYKEQPAPAFQFADPPAPK